jgi:hypothetical protein
VISVNIPYAESSSLWNPMRIVGKSASLRRGVVSIEDHAKTLSSSLDCLHLFQAVYHHVASSTLASHFLSQCSHCAVPYYQWSLRY